MLEGLIRHLGGMDLFTVTTNEGAELRQYRHTLQQLAGFCAAAGQEGRNGAPRLLPAEMLAAAAAASQILRYFLKPNATGA